MFENWPEWYHPPYIPKLTVSEVCMQAKSRGAHLEPALTDGEAQTTQSGRLSWVSTGHWNSQKSSCVFYAFDR